MRVWLRFTIRFSFTPRVRFGVCVRIMVMVGVGLGLG